MSDIDDREASFRRLYQAHYGGITAYARRRLSFHDADDAVAETFTVAWRRLGDIPDGEEAVAWLYGVARRVISQGMRGGQRRSRLFARLASLRRRHEGVPPETDSLGEREMVHLALARMRPGDQELLLLAEWDGVGLPQLASVFECSTNAVTIRLHRARRRFRQTFSALEAETAAEPRQEEPT